MEKSNAQRSKPLVLIKQHMLSLLNISATRAEIFLAWLSLAFLSLILWMPFGFNIVGIHELWTMLDFYQDGHFLLTGHLDGQHDARPFGAWGWLIGYALTQHSFVGLNIAQMLYFCLKGIAVFGIVYELTERKSFSFLVGMLLIIYPADDALMFLRATGPHLAVVFLLFATYFFVRLRTKTSLFRIELLLFPLMLIATVLIPISKIRFVYSWQKMRSEKITT